MQDESFARIYFYYYGITRRPDVFLFALSFSPRNSQNQDATRAFVPPQDTRQLRRVRVRKRHRIHVHRGET